MTALSVKYAAGLLYQQDPAVTTVIIAQIACAAFIWILNPVTVNQTVAALWSQSQYGYAKMGNVMLFIAAADVAHFRLIG